MNNFFELALYILLQNQSHDGYINKYRRCLIVLFYECGIAQYDHFPIFYRLIPQLDSQYLRYEILNLMKFKN